jgi:hypothetical protein
MLDKKVHAIIIISIIAVALSGVYYFAYYSPQIANEEMIQNKQRILLADQEKCATDGAAYYRSFYSTTNLPGYTWDTPEYHYDSKLNTCLAYIRFIFQYGTPYVTLPISEQYNQVVDIYSNQTILYGWFKRDCSTTPCVEKLYDTSESSVPNYTSTQFFVQKEVLFGE